MEFPLSTPQHHLSAANYGDGMLQTGRNNDDSKYGTVMISSFPDCVFLPGSEQFTSDTSGTASITTSPSFCDDDDDNEGIDGIPKLFLKPRTSSNTSLSPSLDYSGVPQSGLSTNPSDPFTTPEGRQSQVPEWRMLRRCVAFSEDSSEVVMENEEEDDDESLALSDDEESTRNGEVVATPLYWEDALGRSIVGAVMDLEETSVTSFGEDDEDSLSGLRFFKQQGERTRERRGNNDELLPPLIPKMDHDDGIYPNRNDSSPFTLLPNVTPFNASERGGIFRRRNQHDVAAPQDNDDACPPAPLKKHNHIMVDRNEFYKPVSSPIRPNLCSARMA